MPKRKGLTGSPCQLLNLKQEKREAVHLLEPSQVRKLLKQRKPRTPEKTARIRQRALERQDKAKARKANRQAPT